MRAGRGGSVDPVEFDAVLTWAEALREENARLAEVNARMRAASAREDRRAVVIGLAAALAFGASGELTRRFMAARQGRQAAAVVRAVQLNEGELAR